MAISPGMEPRCDLANTVAHQQPISRPQRRERPSVERWRGDARQSSIRAVLSPYVRSEMPTIAMSFLPALTENVACHLTEQKKA